MITAQQPIKTDPDKVRSSDGPPRSIASARLLPLLVFFITTTYLLSFCRYSALEPDEGIVLRGAERVLRGQVPYRDFFSFYTPGSYYLIALLFRAFGDSFFVARASVAITGALCAVFTYLLARRFCSTAVSLLTAALTAVAGVSYRFLVLHNWYSTLFCCATLYAAMRLLESRSLKWCFAAGIAASSAVLFEQSKGAGLCLGLVLGVIALARKTRPLLGKGELAIVSLGFVAPFLFTFGYFAYEHALGEMVRSWLWPLHHYGVANRVPYGYQNLSEPERQELFHRGSLGVKAIKIIAISPAVIVPALPIVAILVFVYLVFRNPNWQDADGECSQRFERYALVCGTCAGLLISVIASRSDVIHFMYLSPLWYVVLAWVLGHRASGILHGAQKLFLAYVALAFFLLGFSMFLHARGATDRVDTRRGFIRTSAADTVIPFVQAHTVPRDPLLVYPYLPLYNYLTDTDSPARLDYFQPGMNTSAQARQILQAMQTKDTEVLFEPAFAQKIATAWPGTPAEAVASDPVAEYIRKNYRFCQALRSPMGWRFEFRVRKELNCP